MEGYTGKQARKEGGGAIAVPCPVCGEQTCLEVAAGARREYTVCQSCQSEFQVYLVEHEWWGFDS